MIARNFMLSFQCKHGVCYKLPWKSVTGTFLFKLIECITELQRKAINIIQKLGSINKLSDHTVRRKA